MLLLRLPGVDIYKLLNKLCYLVEWNTIGHGDDLSICGTIYM